jgi:hypothetical protein
VPPGRSPEPAARFNTERKVLDADFLIATMTALVVDHHLHLSVDPDSVVQTHAPDSVPKVLRCSIGFVGEDDARRNVVIERLADQLKAELGLGRELKAPWYACFFSALVVVHPAGFRLTYSHNATLGRRGFYRHLCHDRVLRAALYCRPECQISPKCLY